MIVKRLSLLIVVLSAAVLGCGAAAEPKKMPSVTPAQQAELDKQHAEAKAQQAPADAPAK